MGYGWILPCQARLLKADQLILAGLYLTAALWMSPAMAEDVGTSDWSVSMSAEGTTVSYGEDDSGDFELSFACEADRPDLQIRLRGNLSKSIEAGKLPDVSMENDAMSVGLSKLEVFEQSTGKQEIRGQAPLSDAMRDLLVSGAPLVVTVNDTTETYPMENARDWAWQLVFGCGDKAADGNLDITIINRAGLPIQELAYSEAEMGGSIVANPLETTGLKPDDSQRFTILGGRDICTFEISAVFEEDGEDSEDSSDPLPIGTQDFCENPEFIVHVPSPETLAPEQALSDDDPWVGEWEGEGVSATIRRGTAKPEFLVIDVSAGQPEPSCAGAVTVFGKPQGLSVKGVSYDPNDKAAPICEVHLSINESGEMEATSRGDCTYYHGAACGFDGVMKKAEIPD